MRRLLYFVRELGFDPVKTFRALAQIPWYVSSYLRFRRINQGGSIQFAPVLLDRSDSSGHADGHYFWQDLVCAKWIFEQQPDRHLDVGSRIDGFIAHLLSFRDVEVVDIRPPESEIPGLRTHIADAQSSLEETLGQFDSVSSLHSLEHFGLGRYGDSLDAEGHRKGLSTIANLVKPNGHLYLSYPTGANEIQFNAQRLLQPDWAPINLPNFEVLQLVVIPWKGPPTNYLSLDKTKILPKGSCVLYQLRRTS